MRPGHHHPPALAIRCAVTDVSARSTVTADFQTSYEEVASLAAAVKGDTAARMRLKSYGLVAQLAQIVDAANARLTMMKAGRYQLQHGDSVQLRKTKLSLGVSLSTSTPITHGRRTHSREARLSWRPSRWQL